MTARRIFFEGRVQGVGFRATCKHIAKGFEVTGWVRNLPDGRVEMEVQAEVPDELESFLQAILESGLKGHIRRHMTLEIAPDAQLRTFEIR
jgi:acylphosphatase